jgi:site-specific DNA-methyltransferase (adenine-specific)
MENVLFNEDCFNVFPRIPDGSVQLVVVDLPYGQTNCKWDTQIDLVKMWEQLKRILKPNGQCVFFCSTKFGNSLINSNPKWFRYDIVWEKTKRGGFLIANKQPLRSHEMMYLFHNDKKPRDLNWIYNPQKTAGEPYKKRQNDPSTIKIYGKCPKHEQAENTTGDRFPVSILKFNNTFQLKSKFHPTQKPVELCEWLIKTYSNEGDLVLDFTMGSGSTILGCKKTNRKYIGVEKDGEIYKVALGRTLESKVGESMPGMPECQPF